MAASIRRRRRRTPTRQTRRLLPVLERLDMDVVSTATLNGTRIDAKLVESIVGLERDVTIDGANLLTVQVFDPERELLRADLLGRQLDMDLGLAGTWRLDRPRDVGGLSMQGDMLTLRMWDIGSAALRARSKPLRVSSTKLDIGGFAGVLAREVREDVRLRVVAPYPDEAPPDETTSKTTTSTSKGSARSAPAGFAKSARLKGNIDDGGNSGYLTAAQLRNAAEVLETAQKEKAPPRAVLALVCACLVEGPNFTNSSVVTDGTSVGILQLLDTHGSVRFRLDIPNVVRLFLRKGFTGKGGAIELARKNPGMTAGKIAQTCQGSAYPARYDRQAAHGRKIIAAWQGGSGSSSSTSSSTTTVSRPAQWRRGSTRKPESSWSALDREAKRLGRRRFIALPWLKVPRLVVAADRTLIRAQPHLTVHGLDDEIITEPPSIDLDGLARLQTVDLTVVTSAWSAPPGGVVELADCGPADGPWIMQRLTAPAGSDTARVTLQQPTTKVEAQQDQSTAAGGAGGRGSASSSSGADAVFARGRQISKQNLPYVWGGGHAKAGSPSGGGYDCSGYVVACLAAAGWGFKPGGGTATSGTLAGWGKAGRGEELTVWANGNHVFILGEGRYRGMAIDTSNGYYRRGNTSEGPHLRTGTRPTGSFTPRHWPGH